MSSVYHFTDSFRLPWIILRGAAALRKSTSGRPDFLWATTDDKGDRTAACCTPDAQKAFRGGFVLLVRFTLDSTDFDNWPLAAKRSPGWTALKRGADPSRCHWFARFASEVKSYQSGRWVSIGATRDSVMVNGTSAGIAIGRRVYASTRHITSVGAVAYCSKVEMRQ